MENIVGIRIAQRRKELNLTQEELAVKLGYKSKSTINKIELGINDITQSKLVEFAKVLYTTPSYLMGWDDGEENMSEKDIVLNKAFSERPEMRMLFSVAEKASKEDIEQAIKIIEALKK